MIEVAAKLYVGDVVEMRKVHPCGGVQWEIVRVGADIGIVCRTCGRRVLLPRREFVRGVKRFIQRAGPADKGPADKGPADKGPADKGPAGKEPSQ